MLVLRALYLSDNRVEILRRLHGVARTKVVFDIDPRRVPARAIATASAYASSPGPTAAASTAAAAASTSGSLP